MVALLSEIRIILRTSQSCSIRFNHTSRFVIKKSLQTTLMIDPPTQDSESSMPHPSIIPSCIKVGTRQQGRATDKWAASLHQAHM